MGNNLNLNIEKFCTVSQLPTRKKVIEYYKSHPDSGVLVDINFGFVKFTGVENHVYGPAIKKMIQGLRFNGYPFLPDATFIVSTVDSDYPDWRTAIGKGIWLNSSKYPNEAILSPLWYFVTKDKTKSIEDMKKNKRETDWDSKFQKIIWRGATTGENDPVLVPGKTLPNRSFLVDFSNRFPNLIDAQFTKTTPVITPILENRISKVTPLNPEEQQNYKYIFNVDGNGASYGLYWQLASGSHVIRWSNHRQWFDRFFKNTITEINYPEHLLPVIQNLNDGSTRRKSTVASNTAKRIFNDKYVYKFLYDTLKKYSKLQTRG